MMKVTETDNGHNKMNTVFSPVMANNLKHYIKLSGKTQVQVAKEKGIQPESLSRHISGRSQFSIQDAIEYAAILKCTPEQLLFERNPMPIIGVCKDAVDTEFYSLDQPMKYIQTRSQPLPGHALLRGEWTNAPHADTDYYMLDTRPMKKYEVAQSTYGRAAYVKVSKGQQTLSPTGLKTFLCIPYPMPDGTFVLSTLYDSKTITGVKLDWACPRIMTVSRPELWGWVEIDETEA